MPADYSKVHRLLRILMLLQGGARTARELAELCGVPRRSMYRDLNALITAGFPIETCGAAGEGLYRVKKGFFLLAPQLTEEEALALCVLGDQVAGTGELPLLESAAGAVAKIRSQLPPEMRQKLLSLAQRIHVRLGPGKEDAAAVRDVLEKIQEAMTSGRMLRCVYEAASHRAGAEGVGDGVGAGEGAGRRDSDPLGRGAVSEEEFLLQPYAMQYVNGAWYVVGHHGGRDAVRTLRLSRFVQLELTEAPYRIPEDFCVREHLGNAWGLVRGEPCVVELRLSGMAARLADEVQWHPTQETTRKPDGSVMFRCRVDGLSEITRWVLSLGAECTVIGPEALKSRLRKELEAMLRPLVK